MKSVGSMNSLRGKKVEKIIAKKYNGLLVSHDRVGCDVELEGSLLEVKSSLSWHSYNKGLRHYPGRFLINIEYHEEFKRKADEKGKKVIYGFVRIPRHDDGKIEKDSGEWHEAWAAWENVDKLVKDSKRVRIVKSMLKDGFVRYYYAVRMEHIFGNNS